MTRTKGQTKSEATMQHTKNSFLSDRRFLKYALVAISFSIIALHLFLGIDNAPFHGDEAGWTTAGYYYYQLMFIEHDVSLEKWVRPNLYAFGIFSPPVGKYFIGLMMHTFLPRGQYNYEYNFDKSESDNAKLGNVPPVDVLRPPRLSAALFSLVTCWCLFWYCTKIWNWLTGVAAALILSFNSLFALFAQRAMTDAYIIFFFMLAQVCCVSLFNTRNNKKLFLLLSVLTGIVIGLGAGVKLNGAVAMLYVWIMFGYLLIVERRKLKHIVVLYLAAGILILLGAVLTFAAVNPAFYTLSPEVFYTILMMYVSKWNELMAHAQNVFPQQAIHGTYSVILSRITMDYFHVVLFCCTIFGMIRAVMHLMRDAFRRKLTTMVNPIAFFGVNVIILSSWIPLDWDRYYLPIILAEVPLAAYGLFEMVNIIFPKVTGWLVPSPNSL